MGYMMTVHKQGLAMCMDLIVYVYKRTSNFGPV